MNAFFQFIAAYWLSIVLIVGALAAISWVYAHRKELLQKP